MANFGRKEAELLCEMATILQRKGNKIFKGEGRLNMSTYTLVILNRAIQVLHESNHGILNYSLISGQQQALLDKMQHDIQFVKDIVVQATALKLSHQSNTIQGPLDIGSFEALTELTINRVPVHLIQGLMKLRDQLKQLCVHRSLQSLQDLFENCGGDMSGPMSWSHLTTVNLTQNNLRELDPSLRLLPFLESFDLSHNSISSTDNSLEHLNDLQRLNLSFNQLTALPPFSICTKGTLSTLVLRNNSLETLDGIDELPQLVELDLVGNCISDHTCLSVISSLHKLNRLSLQGNPMSYQARHRFKSIGYVSPLVARTEFVLDGRRLNYSEAMMVQKNKILNLRTSSQFVIEGPVSVLTRETDSGISETERNDVEQIAAPQPICKKKHHHRRKINRKIECSSLLDNSTAEVSSIDSSRGSSPSRSDGYLKTKEDIETMRQLYGDNWLQLLRAREKDQHGLPTQEEVHTTAVSTAATQTASNEEPDGSVVVVLIDDAESMETVKLRHDSMDAWWLKSEEEVQDVHGPESDPFIVTIGEKSGKQLLVTINNRFISEKDLSGALVEKLDLKCLEKIQTRHMEAGAQPLIILKFDYILKNRRKRIYLMEDFDNAKRFANLVKPFVKEHQSKTSQQTSYLCLMCSKEFSKAVQMSKPKFSMFPIKAKGKSEEVKACPSCRSRKVVEIDCTSTASSPCGSLSSLTEAKQFEEQTQKNQSPSGSPLLSRQNRFPPPPSCSPQLPRKAEPKAEKMIFGSTHSRGKAKSSKYKLKDAPQQVEEINSLRTVSSRHNANISSERTECSDSGQQPVSYGSDITILPKWKGSILSDFSRACDAPLSSTVTADTGRHLLNDTEEDSAPEKPNWTSDPLLLTGGAVDSGLVSSVCEQSLTNKRLSTVNKKKNISDEEDTFHGADISSKVDNTLSEQTPVKTVSTGELDTGLKKFSHIDHRIKLFLMMSHFGNQEDVELLLQCTVVQHIIGEFRGLLVITNFYVYVFRLHGANPCEQPEICVKCYGKNPVTELQYIDIGLGYQSFRLEFEADGASFSFLIGDSEKCQEFVNLLIEFFQTLSMTSTTKMKGITTLHPQTLQNLSEQVLGNDAEAFKGVNMEHPEESLAVYLLCYLLKNNTVKQSVSVAIFPAFIFLLEENHQWPMPRLQFQIPLEDVGPQFVVLDQQAINDVTGVVLCKDNPWKMKLSFLNEVLGTQFSWEFLFESECGIKSLIDHIKGPWEKEFGVNLEIIIAD